jgi:chemotaxis protein MotB
MITLMLTFFVLILSMSNIEANKVMGIAGSVKKILGIADPKEGSATGLIESVVPSLRDEDIERARAAGGVAPAGPYAERIKVLSRALSNLTGEKTVPGRNGFVLSVGQGLLFTGGSADLSTQGRQQLKAMGEILKRSDAFIRVEGNTDDQPVALGKYPSNWDLSLALAGSVVKCLVTEGGVAPERLSAAGYGETRPRVPNDNIQNRAMNRRIDFMVTFEN